MMIEHRSAYVVWTVGLPDIILQDCHCHGRFSVRQVKMHTSVGLSQVLL